MKKFFLTIFLFFVFSMGAFALDYTPSYKNPYMYYGEGLITTNKPFYVYKLPDENSEKTAFVQGEKILQKGRKTPIEDFYIAYAEDKNIALVAVKEETDDWFLVCYNQKNKLFGWVKKSEFIDYLSWSDLFNFYGRKLGVYVFRNVEEKYKKLYSAPDIESQVTDDFTFPRHISLWLIGGDWILVKVTTYEGDTKTGWLRWRLDDKSIIAFPDFRKFEF